MTKKSDAPAIRFKGFSDAWEQRKLGDMMNVTSVKRIHQSDWTDSGVRFLRARDIVAAAKNEEPDDYLYISKEKYEEYSALSGKVGVSDLLVTGVGTIGVPYLVRNLEPLYFKDGNIIWFQNSDKIDGKFLFYSFSAEQIQGFINESAGIGTVGTYTIESGKKTPISLPNQIEQAKVGEFFQQLDNLITLHQRKFEKLTNVKKSMLEKMFPQNGSSYPEIRFKGFTDPWEQRKWINTVDISTNMVDPKSGKYDLLPHVAPGNIESFTGRLYDNVKLVGEENLISGKFVFNVGDIVYGKINPQLGKYVFARFSGLTSADAYVLNAKNGIVQKFLYAVIQTRDFYDYSVSVSKRSGMPKINRDELNAYSYWAPSESEQLKIGEYLLTLDHLITLHQRELKKLQNIKKSMLEKMFV